LVARVGDQTTRDTGTDSIIISYFSIDRYYTHIVYLFTLYLSVPNHFLILSFVLEFQKIAMATAIGFCIMGFIGFFVKLIHIPINNIIVYVLDSLKLKLYSVLARVRLKG